jgi:hypothetical protein
MTGVAGMTRPLTAQKPGGDAQSGRDGRGLLAVTKKI